MPYTPPRSSQPPADFALNLSPPPGSPHNRTELTPVSFLTRAALIAPNKLAISHPERGYQFTYAQWAARVLSLTFAIQSVPGFKAGDRVAVICPNAPLIADAHFGILAAGGIITPVNVRNTPKEVEYVLQHSGSTIILVDHQLTHLVPSPPPSGVTVVVSNDSGGQDPNDPYEAFLDRGYQAWQAAEEVQRKRGLGLSRSGWRLITTPTSEELPCALCYTSGTTGRPKGVITTHRGSYLAAIAGAFEAQFAADTVYLWVLPMFHACGWTYPWGVTAAMATHVTIRKVDNDVIWDALLNHGVTHYTGAPTVQIGITNHPKARKLDRIVKVSVAASAPTAALLAKMESLNLHPVHVYGATETYGPFTRRYSEPHWVDLDVDERARLMARQGHSFLVADECRVVRPVDPSRPEHSELVDVAQDGKEAGEIVMRGNIAMKEYYKDPAATSKIVINGWLHLGDIAVRHPGGEIQIMDRGKDIIISGGENISSLAVEQELAAHPDILECCVVARPHEKWGERGQAYIVLNAEGAKKHGKAAPGTREHEALVADLKKHCKSRMSGFAVPEWFDIVDELPKTSTGKVQKNVLRAKFAAAAKL